MRFAILCGAALLLGLPTVGHLSADPPESPAPLEKYRALVKAHQQAREAFGQAYHAAKTDEERQRVLKEFGPKASANHYAGQFLQLIRNYPKDPVVLEAFRWLLGRVPSSPETGQAVEIVLAHWIEDERLGRCVQVACVLPLPGVGQAAAQGN